MSSVCLSFTLEYMEMFGMADGRNFPYDDLFNTDNPNNVDIFVGRDHRLYETMVNRNNLVEQSGAFEHRDVARRQC